MMEGFIKKSMCRGTHKNYLRFDLFGAGLLRTQSVLIHLVQLKQTKTTKKLEIIKIKKKKSNFGPTDPVLFFRFCSSLTTANYQSRSRQFWKWFLRMIKFFDPQALSKNHFDVVWARAFPLNHSFSTQHLYKPRITAYNGDL